MMCSSGKATYNTRARAKLACKTLKKRGTGLTKLRPYQCRECLEWHLTSHTDSSASAPVIQITDVRGNR